MPVPTAFHPRTAALCHSLSWKEWSGYHAVCSYDSCHEREYLALRHAAGLIDVSPLFKTELRGPDAARLLSTVTVRNLEDLAVGRVTYLCWCDDDGKVVDDGTVARLDEQRYRLTGNGPHYAWLHRYSAGYDVQIEECTDSTAVLALQGPLSRDILAAAGVAAIEKLRFFRCMSAKLGDLPVEISRTGYTGDLGYEIWTAREHALPLWDRLIEAGAPYRIEPAGLHAMDVTRIEAGFVLCGVDYFPAHHCLIDARKSSPDEIGLGRCVELDREPFVGQRAIRKERERAPQWRFVGLEIDWDDYERLFANYGLPPQVRSGGWRDAVPLYDRRGRQIGQATSGAWSPLLKKNLALATVAAVHASVGERMQIEVTAEYERKTVGATVVKLPFFNPARKRST